MKRKYVHRQVVALVLFVLMLASAFVAQGQDGANQPEPLSPVLQKEYFGENTALEVLNTLEVKGRAPKTDYRRAQFGDGWARIEGCSVREVILARDMTGAVMADDECRVQMGMLHDPYTGMMIQFQRGETTSQAVQIDHVVALSDAWQKGAQQLSFEDRVRFSNDPLNLLAVDGPANQAKGDADAATWLPPNKPFRCQYVARQVAVKRKYYLWVTEAEKSTIAKVLEWCTA